MVHEGPVYPSNQAPMGFKDLTLNLKKFNQTDLMDGRVNYYTKPPYGSYGG